MRVFITGANGFIGSAVVRELLDSGHDVVGLVRSDAAAAAVQRAGAEVLRGSIDDLETLIRGAEGADGVIHTAYIHDYAQPPEVAAQADRRAIETLAAALAGSGRPLVVTSATGLLGPGYVATEEDRPRVTERSHPRAASDLLALELASRGNNVSIVRPASSVHGEGDHAFIPTLIETARSKGVSAYVGDGSNRWPAVHRLDAGCLYRLALEQGEAGSVFHAVAEEGVEFAGLSWPQFCSPGRPPAAGENVGGSGACRPPNAEHSVVPVSPSPVWRGSLARIPGLLL